MKIRIIEIEFEGSEMCEKPCCFEDECFEDEGFEDDSWDEEDAYNPIWVEALNKRLEMLS